MKKCTFIFRFGMLLACMLFLTSPLLAKSEYSYVKASLGYPWFMFFVFMVLVMIPFLLIVVLSWRNEGNNEQPHGKQ